MPVSTLRLLLLFVFWCPLLAFAQQKKQQMMDPGIDKPGEEWCYLATKSTTVIGMPFQPDITQVTYDGAVYTGSAELCFFFGVNDHAMPMRGKTFLNGWIPIVQYHWQEKTIQYSIEYFTQPLAGEDMQNTVNFVQVTMQNTGAATSVASVKSALRYSGGDYRLAPADAITFNTHWQYTMQQNAATRADSLVYTYSAGAALQAASETSYSKPFSGSDYYISARAECCLAGYKRTLKPGEKYSVVFKMPRVPVANGNKQFIAKLQAANYQTYREKAVSYWQNLLRNAPTYEVPEKRFTNAYRAGLVHILLATRQVGGRRYHTDGLPYPDFFLTSAPEPTMLYLTAGLPQLSTQMIVPDAIAQQQPDGLYFDKAIAHNRIIPAAQGHILYCIAMSAIYTQDTAFAKSVYPSVAKGIAFIKNAIDTTKYGLLPRCYPFDNEMIDGYYTGHNTVALMGLRLSVRLARMVGNKEDEAAWTALANRYETNILKGIQASVKPNGYVPLGLYEYTTGPASVPAYKEYQTGSNWENMILAYPTEILPPTDEKITGTLQDVRRQYAEGIMTYRHG